MTLTDFGPLIDPPREPSARIMFAIDLLSIALPALAGILSIWAGIEALNKADTWAAALGIGAGVASAFGVLFTGWASRIRDGRLVVARAVGWLGVEAADQAMTAHPGAF